MNSIIKWVGLTFTLLAVSGISSAIASEGRTPCKKTAYQMHKACKYETLEAHKTTLANCTNLNNRSDRQACRKEASTAIREASQICKGQLEARVDACDVLQESRYDPDPFLDQTIHFVNPDDVQPGTANPYVSIVEGHTFLLRAGEEGEEVVVVHTTDEVRMIQDTPCRVVVDVVLEREVNEDDGSIDYVPVEVTDDWFAQDVNGDVYYCGELARNYEDGRLTDLDGSFEAGQEHAKGGMLIMAYPEIGLAHRQEFSLGVAEDIIQYMDVSAHPEEENEKFPCSENGGCLMTYDFSPLAPEATEFKYYIPGVGFVLAQAMENGEMTGERETLECAGDSLDVLQQPECGIADPEELLETLCELSPDTFCE
jgi:hypothetical protein